MSLESTAGQLREQRITLHQRSAEAGALLADPSLRGQGIASLPERGTGLPERRTDLTERGDASDVRILLLVMLRQNRIQQRVLQALREQGILQQADGRQRILPAKRLRVKLAQDGRQLQLLQMLLQLLLQQMLL